MAWSLVASMTEADPHEAEAELLAGCRAGDRASIRALYDGHIRHVMATARRLGLPPTEAEDVAQDVFAVAFRDIGRVRPGGLSAWLFRLTSNRVNDRFRRRKVRETFARIFGPTEEPEARTTPERDLLRKDAETRVGRILAKLSQKKRDVFVLFEIEGLPGDEIAERLDIPVDTVWTRLYHARREFAKHGQSLEQEELERSGEEMS